MKNFCRVLLFYKITHFWLVQCIQYSSALNSVKMIPTQEVIIFSKSILNIVFVNDSAVGTESKNKNTEEKISGESLFCIFFVNAFLTQTVLSESVAKRSLSQPLLDC
jgi:hypothetical protein